MLDIFYVAPHMAALHCSVANFEILVCSRQKIKILILQFSRKNPFPSFTISYLKLVSRCIIFHLKSWEHALC